MSIKHPKKVIDLIEWSLPDVNPRETLDCNMRLACEWAVNYVLEALVIELIEDRKFSVYFGDGDHDTIIVGELPEKRLDSLHFERLIEEQHADKPHCNFY